MKVARSVGVPRAEREIVEGWWWSVAAGMVVMLEGSWRK